MSRDLEDWIEGYMKYTDDTESSDVFRRWTAISVVASAMQRKCYLNWGLETFYPNLYIVLVGPSGARKGTAMKPGINIARQTPGIQISSDSATRQALIRELKRTTDTDIDEEGNMTFNSSLTIFSPELTVFLGYNNLELMANMTDWFDCGTGDDGVWTYETISRNKEEVKGIWVNLLGATTPELIQSTLPRDAIGGGLCARIIFVYSEKKKKPVPIPFLTKEQKEVGLKLIQDLERIALLSGEYSITESCISKYAKWYLDQETNKPFTDLRLVGYLQRRGSHLLKLCMIMNASRCDNMVVEEQDFDRALGYLNDVEEKMPYTFSGVGASDISDILSRVMKTIAYSKEISRQELMRKFYYDADKQTMERVISTLTSMGFCKQVFPESGGSPKIIFLKNVH